jgi:ribonuclease HI
MSNSIQSAEKLALYFDGSCQENRNVTADTPTGWGVVIVQGDSGLGKGDGDIIEEISGSVITDSNLHGWLGAEVGSNNTAELTALAHALRWLLTKDNITRVTIRGDSNYALKIATREWRAKKNLKLATRVVNLLNEVSTIIDVELQHVRAHRGHRWNERADHLAWRACINETPLPLQFWKPGMR